MRYSELVQFDPIQDVIQLKDSAEKKTASKLVRSYVFSQDMTQRVSEVLLPQLSLENTDNTKGILLVGNYGTGKSHLFSVLSAVAEDPSHLQELTNETVRAAGEKHLAGRFKVIRAECTGSAAMDFRSIITDKLTQELAKWGVHFEFPTVDKIAENKSSFKAMMAAFHEQYPDQGLLFILDEFLEFLESRKDQELTRDLSFLREVGEVCKNLRFRFIAGVQEAIFDSPRFSHVAESLNRVKDRFQQVHIASADIKFVASHRLLKKTDAQRSQIRAYLEPFAPYYGDWSQRLPELIDLFPVHPDYFDTFGKLPMFEKRGVLQLLSSDLKALDNQELPQDRPGLLALDGVWQFINANPSFRASPEYKTVLDCTRVLEDKLLGFPKARASYVPLAKRLIHGLAVHRLTVNDLHSPLGLTAEELRDRLCLYSPLVALTGSLNKADDLLGVINVALIELKKAVSGQYLSENPTNRQHYLDLNKTEDFDARVTERAETLEAQDLDRAYFKAMLELLHCGQPTPNNPRAWEKAIPWQTTKTDKMGWLFFGTPNERSTASPPRDFYLYFVQPYDAPRFKDEQKPEEVFFRLSDSAKAAIKPLLQRYAAARALESLATGSAKDAYFGKVREAFTALNKTLQEKLFAELDVTHQGKTTPLTQALGAANPAHRDLRDWLFAAASNKLDAHFQSTCGSDYPRFQSDLSFFGETPTISGAVRDALNHLAGSPLTKQGANLLHGLKLLEGDRLVPTESPYAAPVLTLLKSKAGKVVNRSELLVREDGLDYYRAETFRLEPQLFLVVLAALLREGHLEFCVPGKDFTASDLKELATRAQSLLEDFASLKQPKGWDRPTLTALFSLLGLNAGQVTQLCDDPTKADTVVAAFQTTLQDKIRRLAEVSGELGAGIPFWGTTLLEEPRAGQMRSALKRAQDGLQIYAPYNTAGRFKNLRGDPTEIDGLKPALGELATYEKLKKFADQLANLTAYLASAEAQLPPETPWAQSCIQAKSKLRAALADPTLRLDDAFRHQTLQELAALKNAYREEYLRRYRLARLDQAGAQKQTALRADSRLIRLRALASLPGSAAQELETWERELVSLKTGPFLTPADLEQVPAKDFNPAFETRLDGISATQKLEQLAERLDKLDGAWAHRVLSDLADPVVQARLKFLPPEQAKLLNTCLKNTALPDSLEPDFLQALFIVFQELQSVALTADELFSELFTDGAPLTPDALRSRFEVFLKKHLQNKDAAKVRFLPHQSSR